MILKVTDPEKVRQLFDGWEETMIWSCLQGIMGSLYAEYPESRNSEGLGFSKNKALRETENPDTGNSAQDGHRRKILLEANYRNPSFREELTSRQMSVHKDFTYIPGHQWLLYQAYAGYDLFTGETPDLLSMAKIIM